MSNVKNIRKSPTEILTTGPWSFERQQQNWSKEDETQKTLSTCCNKVVFLASINVFLNLSIEWNHHFFATYVIGPKVDTGNVASNWEKIAFRPVKKRASIWIIQRCNLRWLLDGELGRKVEVGVGGLGVGPLIPSARCLRSLQYSTLHKPWSKCVRASVMKQRQRSFISYVAIRETRSLNFKRTKWPYRLQ